jgi:hypothetical protein
MKDMQRDFDKRFDAIMSGLKAKGPEAAESIETAHRPENRLRG